MAGAVRSIRSCGHVGGASMSGSAGRRVGHRGRRVGRMDLTPASGSAAAARRLRPVVLHDAALGLAAGLATWRRSACRAGAMSRLHEDASRAEPDSLARAAGLAERCAAVLVSDDSFAPPRASGRPAPGGGARNRPARPAQPRARAAPAGPGGAPARRGPRPPVRASRCWSSTAGTTPTRPSRPSALAKAEEPELQLVLAALLDACAAEELAGREGGLRLRRRPGGRAAAHQLRGARQPRGRRAPVCWRAPCSSCSLREGFEPGPVRGALEAHARRGRADASADRPRRRGRLPRRRTRSRSPRRLVELVRDPGLAMEMGAPVASACASASWSRRALERELRRWQLPDARTRYRGGRDEGHCSPTAPRSSSRRRHRRRRRRARSARAWPGRRSAQGQTASCATSRRRSPDGAESRSSPSRGRPGRRSG